MYLHRISFFLLFFLLVCFSLADYHYAASSQDNKLSSSAEILSSGFNQPIYSNRLFSDFRIKSSFNTYHCTSTESVELAVVPTPTDGGIKEIIPDKFQEKYQKWKSELLSTEQERRQWESYSNNKHFILTITVAAKEGEGAGTGKYLWDEQGNLVGATITLGNKIDKGLPNPIYFPIMNSLSSDVPSYTVSGDVLAATKFAHEFGHVNQTAKMKSDIFQLQNKLMIIYNEILLKNGYNTNDQKLIDLAKQMGGTPVEIWENREYWGEANAMFYLAGRITKESYYCSVYNKMKQNIKLYAKDYEKRFDQIAEETNLETACGKL